jgi:hypothetical protein
MRGIENIQVSGNFFRHLPMGVLKDVCIKSTYSVSGCGYGVFIVGYGGQRCDQRVI